MEDITNLPIEIGIEKAKRDIVTAINQIGREYSLPSSILFMVVEEVLNSSKNSTYTTIIANYDISIPKSPTESDQTKSDTPKVVNQPKPKKTKTTTVNSKSTGDKNGNKQVV